MILRLVLAVFGVVELLFPRRVVDYAMDVTTTGELQYLTKFGTESATAAANDRR